MMLVGMLICAPLLAEAQTDPDLASAYLHEVDRRLDVPTEVQAEYAQRLEQALTAAGLGELGAQHFVVVDRSPQVQAVFLYLHDSQSNWRFIGASPASTGRAGGFEHFLTPLGVFAHSLDNPDFRAEGTTNENGIRGYGVRGMRVFDFGWVLAERTWGTSGKSEMRLQMHATDPVLLEPRLGRAESKGCIRIPASLNRFIDRYGLLDADYEAALARGETFWVLAPERTPTPWPGRYLLVIDSAPSTRPAWAAPTKASSTPPAGAAPVLHPQP